MCVRGAGTGCELLKEACIYGVDPEDWDYFEILQERSAGVSFFLHGRKII